MIPTHPFGRTGHMSTRTIFGAAAFSRVTQEEADRTLDVLLHFGFLDDAHVTPPTTTVWNGLLVAHSPPRRLPSR